MEKENAVQQPIQGNDQQNQPKNSGPKRNKQVNGPDEGIVNEQEQNKIINTPDEDYEKEEESENKKKGYKEGMKNDDITEDADDKKNITEDADDQKIED